MNKVFLGILLLGNIFSHPIEGCTGIKLTAQDGSIVEGRTLEFGIIIDIKAAVVPRGYQFSASTSNGAGLQYVSKYGSVGSMTFNTPLLMDGLNEKGLSIGTFYFPGFAEYAQLDAENQKQALSPIDFPNWILSQFATVEEVKAALSHVVIVPTLSKDWGSSAPPFHYVVFDKNGKGLVIEPIGGKLITYENQLGVFTNSPNFDWHMTNLRNYINLTPFNVKPVSLNEVTLAPFGEGSGMVGLPGDFTPPSRFVRAAIFSATATPSKNSQEAIFQIFHILNQFDIPVGIARTKEGQAIYTDYTQLTCARDPQTLKYFFKTYNDQNIKFIDLTKFDLDAKEIKTIKLAGFSEAEDISAQLK